MTALNDLDGFHLVIDALGHLPQTGDNGFYLNRQLKNKVIEDKQYIDPYVEDMPKIHEWKWNDTK